MNNINKLIFIAAFAGILIGLNNKIFPRFIFCGLPISSD